MKLCLSVKFANIDFFIRNSLKIKLRIFMGLCFYRYLELYEWELNALPFVDTIVGRHVYVCVARNVLRQRYFKDEDLSIKSLLSSTAFSDRAVRLKIREMESTGYLLSKFSICDKRIRVLKPTEKLISLIDSHALMLYESAAQDYHLIQKETSFNNLTGM